MNHPAYDFPKIEEIFEISCNDFNINGAVIVCLDKSWCGFTLETWKYDVLKFGINKYFKHLSHYWTSFGNCP